ncbi:MAG: glycosyltransferase family 2 protein [Paludibacteraceae bacterium]|nr:glycosyltransferase family 2 protein [Paludibacteraceae bacterium]
MKDTPLVSVVIPCYNSAQSLPELVKRIDETLRPRGTYEIVCVNDCSRDNTMEVLTQLASEYSQLKVIDLVFNVGQFKALLCAMEHSRGETVVTIDDDLQHGPEDIPLLLDHLDAHPEMDVVIGAYESKQHKMYRNLGTSLIAWVDKHIFEKPEGLQSTSFRAIRRVVVDALTAHKTQFPVMGPLILNVTRRVCNVPVQHHKRKYGKSGYRLSKLIGTTFDNVVNFSSLPLKFISILGSVFSVVGLCIALFFVCKYLIVGIPLPGWTSLMVMLNFYSGLILLGIGIIGEYLIRILKESKGSPRYSIRKTINIEEQ